MPKTRYGWSAILLFMLIFSLYWLETSRTIGAGDTETSTAVEAARVGYTAPNFVLTTIKGDEMRLSDLRGKPVILNFWATWCGPCRAEMPAFARLATDLPNDISVIGVNQGESAEIIRDFADELAVTYPLLVDLDQSVNRQYGVRGLPTTLFIDADGIIRDQIIGAASEAVLKEKIAPLFDR
ncbi:MAG TPA: TlpA family protein disulfide reductase [Anaerolineae bacterium]|nr:TlpA family protein disulfide reductase [Anaerolineae bacterium]